MKNHISKHLVNEGGEFLRPLFKRLNNENIRYCVVRNYEYLPDSTHGSDVDMWVHTDDLVSFEEILKSVSKEAEMPLVSYYDHPTQYKVCYMGIQDGVQLDIFKGNIYWGNKIMFSGESIERNIVMNNNLKVLNEEFTDLMSVIKEFIYTQQCKQKYIDKIYKTGQFSYEKLKRYLDCFHDEFLQFFAKCICNQSINENMKRLAKLSRNCITDKGAVSLWKFKFSKLKRLSKKPGFVICVEGTDGAGKSYIIDKIEPMLNGAFHNKLTYNHLRPNYFPDIAVLFGRRKKNQAVQVVSNPHSSKPSGFLLSIVRVSYYMLDYSIGYLISIFPQICTRYHVYIFDRYFYDYYIDQRRAHVNLPKCIYRFFELFVPSPDITLCLGGDPEIIYNRKPETSLEEVTRQTKELRAFCHNRKNTFWIDTTISPEESIKQAMNAIISVMSERFKDISYTSKIK